MATLSRREMLRELRRARKADPWFLPAGTVAHPRTRSECADGPRPCPLVGCRYHLYLDVDPENGSIKFNRPDVALWARERSCALDEAERGGMTLEEVSEVFGITRERIRQLEAAALRKLTLAIGNPDELTVHSPAPAPQMARRGGHKREPTLRTSDVLGALGLNKGDTWLRRVLRQSMNLEGWPSPKSMTDSA